MFGEQSPHGARASCPLPSQPAELSWVWDAVTGHPVPAGHDSCSPHSHSSRRALPPFQVPPGASLKATAVSPALQAGVRAHFVALTGGRRGFHPNLLLCYHAQDTQLGTLTTTPRAGSPEWQAKGREGLSMRHRAVSVPWGHVWCPSTGAGTGIQPPWCQPAQHRASGGTALSRLTLSWQVQRVWGEGGDCHDAEAERQRAERGTSSQGSEQISQVHLDRYQGCAPGVRGVRAHPPLQHFGGTGG